MEWGRGEGTGNGKSKIEKNMKKNSICQGKKGVRCRWEERRKYVIGENLHR